MVAAAGAAERGRSWHGLLDWMAWCCGGSLVRANGRGRGGTGWSRSHGLDALMKRVDLLGVWLSAASGGRRRTRQLVLASPPRRAVTPMGGGELSRGR